MPPPPLGFVSLHGWGCSSSHRQPRARARRHLIASFFTSRHSSRCSTHQIITMSLNPFFAVLHLITMSLPAIHEGATTYHHLVFLPSSSSSGGSGEPCLVCFFTGLHRGCNLQSLTCHSSTSLGSCLGLSWVLFGLSFCHFS